MHSGAISNLLDRGANAGTTRNEKGQSTDSSHLFKVPGSPFLPFLIHFCFSPALPLPVLFFFSFVFASEPGRIDLGRLLALLAAQLPSLPLSMPAARRALRQAATACDRVKHSVEGYGGIFGETTGFLS